MKLFLLIFGLFSNIVFLQAQTEVEALRKAAQSKVAQNKFEEAFQILESALLLSPDNVDVIKDQMFYAYLNRDYAKAIDLGKNLISKPGSDAQSFQILGMCYIAIADSKEGDKLYRAALKKFPQSGILYAEYGHLLFNNQDILNAVKQWEKGIELDPSHSSNYYYLTKHYAQTGNIIWGLIYGETFINIESLTKRTAEIKVLVNSGYRKVLENKGLLSSLKAGGVPFELAFSKSLSAAATDFEGDITMDAITAFRARFVYHWNNNASNFPTRLFEWQTQLIQDGMFNAYNRWIFQKTDDQDYQNWISFNTTEYENYTAFQQNVLFKVPAGQYYIH
jgi:tetratricopeptide (TPR) repeat protein